MRHPAIEELCGFPSGLVFTLFRRNRKLDALLVDVKKSIDEWLRDEVAFRNKVCPPSDSGFETPLEPLGRSYAFNSLGQSSLTYWYDYYFDDDGLSEKSESTQWEDYIFSEGPYPTLTRTWVANPYQVNGVWHFE